MLRTLLIFVAFFSASAPFSAALAEAKPGNEFSTPGISMTYQDAYQYCVKQGGRLPTAREVARWATHLGVADMRPTAYPNLSVHLPQIVKEINQMREKGFLPMLEPSPRFGQDVIIVEFYYNAHAFKNYVTGNEGHGFWTQTPAPASGWDSQKYVFTGFESAAISSLNFEFKAVPTEDSEVAPARCLK